MKRMITGIRSTGIPHLGNILGVIIPTIEIINKKNIENCVFILIADLHALIELKDIRIINHSVYKIVATWLALGLNIKHCLLYRQSDVQEIMELYWYLNCIFPYNRLKLTHTFKKYSTKKQQINMGIFTYPILMAADILLFDAENVLIGRDQLQHVEITRKISRLFNNKIHKKLFITPNPIIKQHMNIVGTDGEKMSKSYNNYINIFSDKKNLKNQIMKIQTDTKSLKDKKNPEKSYIIKLYKLIASKKEIKNIEEQYRNGNYGYLESKILLYECILNKFSLERDKFSYYIKNKNLLDNIIISGAKKAKQIANKKINYIRKYLGFNKI